MKIIALWTNEINTTLENGIMACFNKTFSQSKPTNYFQWKFRDNPFGESLHIIASDKDKVISTRVFWRLDLNEIEAYQCVDTSVLPEYQGKGIFGKTTQLALKILSKKFIYNHPNKFSAPSYLKYGWKTVKDSKLIKINFTSFMLERAPLIEWKTKTLRWRFENNPDLKYYTMMKNDFYYIFSIRRKNLFILLGKTKSKIDLDYVNPFICFSFDKCASGLSFYSRLPYMSKSKIKHKLHSYLFDIS